MWAACLRQMGWLPAPRAASRAALPAPNRRWLDNLPMRVPNCSRRSGGERLARLPWQHAPDLWKPDPVPSRRCFKVSGFLWFAVLGF